MPFGQFSSRVLRFFRLRVIPPMPLDPTIYNRRYITLNLQRRLIKTKGVPVRAVKARRDRRGMALLTRNLGIGGT